MIITANTADRSTMRQALAKAWEALGAAIDEDADDIRLSILLANVHELERMLGAIEGV